eukprot:g2226.t1
MKKRKRKKSCRPLATTDAGTVSFMLSEAGWSPKIQRQALRLFKDACISEEGSSSESSVSETMGIDTFRKVMSTLGVRRERIDYYFTACDRDRSGRLDYREFLLGMAALDSSKVTKNDSSDDEEEEVTESPAKRRRKTGKQNKGTGKNTGSKNMKGPHRHGSSIGSAVWSQERARYIFHLYDLDGQGSLTFDEFKRMVRHLRRLSGRDVSPEAVEKEALNSFDHDPTRKISEEEFVQVVYGSDHNTFAKVTSLFSAPVSLSALLDGNFTWSKNTPHSDNQSSGVGKGTGLDGGGGSRGKDNNDSVSSNLTSTLSETSSSASELNLKAQLPPLTHLSGVTQLPLYTPRPQTSNGSHHAAVNSPRARHRSHSQSIKAMTQAMMQDDDLATDDAVSDTASENSNLQFFQKKNIKRIRLDPYAVRAYDDGSATTWDVESNAMASNMHLKQAIAPTIGDLGPDRLSPGVITAQIMHNLCFNELLPLASGRGEQVLNRLKVFPDGSLSKDRSSTLKGYSDSDSSDSSDTSHVSLSYGSKNDFEWRINQIIPCRNVGELCREVLKVVKSQPTVVDLESPAKVFGDIHGQLHDLLLFFKMFGQPTRCRNGDIDLTQYVFVGDFVDRGSHSVEVVLLLFSLKVLFPDRIWLIRGNHEDRELNENYGFQRECRTKYPKDMSSRALATAVACAIEQARFKQQQRQNGDESDDDYIDFETIDESNPDSYIDELGFDPTEACEGDKVYSLIEGVFDCLPLAAVIDERIVCLHGGLGDGDWSLDELRQVQRPITSRDIRDSRMLINILWSDPSRDDEDEGLSNNSRGGGIVTFGPNIVDKFCEKENIELIIRAHEPFLEGYHFFAGGRLASVFTARDYCGAHKNDGAFLVIRRDGLVTPRILRSSTHSPLTDLSFQKNEGKNVILSQPKTPKKNSNLEITSSSDSSSSSSSANDEDDSDSIAQGDSEENKKNEYVRDMLSAAGWGLEQLHHVLQLFRTCCANSSNKHHLNTYQMDLDKFLAVMTLVNVDVTLAPLYFRAFDRDGNGVLDYREFLLGMAALDPANQQTVSQNSKNFKKANGAWSKERAGFIFRIYDVKGRGYLCKDDLLRMITHMRCLKTMDSSTAAVQREIDKIVKSTNCTSEKSEIQLNEDDFTKYFVSNNNDYGKKEGKKDGNWKTKKPPNIDTSSLCSGISLNDLFRASMSPSQIKKSWPVSKDVSPIRSAGNYKRWQ